MTIRHWTGSSILIGLLNGLGHSVCHSVVLEHDSALATMELARDNLVPAGFEREVHTTIIWDNNDFSEETNSGEGTTHNTNGIIVQRLPENVSSQDVQRTGFKKTRQRSIEPPPKNILTYYAQRKTGPVRRETSDSFTTPIPTQKPFVMLDNAFCLSKLPPVSNILPG